MAEFARGPIGSAVARKMSESHDGHDLSELTRAVVQDDNELIRELTRKGHTVNWEPFPFEESTLHVAADRGNAEIIPVLLDAGGEQYINSIGCGYTPLGMAVTKGHLGAVEALISRGADVNARDDENLADPPLTDAVDGGYEEIVRALLSAGADPTIPGWVNLTPLDTARRRFEKTPDDLSRRIFDAVSKAASKGST